MREMPSMREIHAHDSVTRLDKREVGSHVCLASGMRLDIDITGSEKFHRTVLGQLFGHVNKLATAIVTFAWVSFCIFVGQNRTLCFAHRGRDKVFRCDKFKLTDLAPCFVPYRFSYFWIAQYKFIHGSYLVFWLEHHRCLGNAKFLWLCYVFNP